MNSQINSIMKNRQNRFDNRARRMLPRNNNNVRFQVNNSQESNDLRNDNDLQMVERQKILNDNNFMTNFDESYYLENMKNDKVTKINSEGKIIDSDENDPVKASLKKKALDLETLIVERLARDKYNDANRIFSVLTKMYKKFDDENVKDTYFRVLQSLPDDLIKNEEIYSYRQDKNNFKDILNEMKNNNNIMAFNEGNACISSLGEMWESCDLDICSQKCKDKILNAMKESKEEECESLVTGYDEEKNTPLSMEDDIKSVILDRLNYCKKIAELKNDNLDVFSYKDTDDLKNKTIVEIKQMSELANNHYRSCVSKASEFFANDPKYREILTLLKTIDYDKLSLDRLQDIRNSLTLMPSCDTLRYRDFEKNRDKSVKDGMRVGKFIIPKDTDFYEQLKGKDKPNIYKDLTSDKNYLYDSYSKILTPLEYPMTHETQLNKKLQDEGLDAPSPSFENLMEQKLVNTDFSDIIPAPSPVESNNIDKKILDNLKSLNDLNELSPSASNRIVEIVNKNNQNNLENNVEDNKDEGLIFGLKMVNVLEYGFLILVMFIIIFAAALFV